MRVCRNIFMPTFRSMLLIVVGLAARTSVLAATFSAHADQTEYGAGYLNSRTNGIRECHIVAATDGLHVVASIARKNVGNAVRFQRFDDEVFDYVFNAKPARHGAWITEQAKLEKPGTLDIGLASAMALAGDPEAKVSRKLIRIFSKGGTYLLFLGYAFDSEDEPEIGGVCEIKYNLSTKTHK